MALNRDQVPLNTGQEQYLLGTLIPCAERLVQAVGANRGLLTTLINEGLLHTVGIENFVDNLLSLPGCMRSLLTDHKFVINATMDVSMLANAQTQVVKGKPIVVAVELRPELLDPSDATSVLSRTRTLIHEVSHTIAVDDCFPMVDYCYFTGWAMPHLGPLRNQNADLFAEASMLGPEDPTLNLAEPGVQGGRWSYRTYNNTVVQLATLREAHVDHLSAALAWMDLRINRAWICMFDYYTFATNRDTGGTTNTDSMRNIEGQLANWGIVEKREWTFAQVWVSGKTLKQPSIDAVVKISKAITRVKGWIAGLRLRIFEGADVDFIKPSLVNGIQVEPGIVRVSRNALSWNVQKLGDAILDKIFVALPNDATEMLRLPAIVHQTDLLSLLVDNDRALPKERLITTQVWSRLVNTAPVPPADARATHELDASLTIAVAESQAIRWRNMAAVSQLQRGVEALKTKKAPTSEMISVTRAFEEMSNAIAGLPAAPDPLNVRMTGRAVAAINMIKQADTDIMRIVEVQLKDDSTRLAEWRTCSTYIQGINYF